MSVIAPEEKLIAAAIKLNIQAPGSSIVLNPAKLSDFDGRCGTKGLMMTTTKLQATCSVCFHTHKLYGNGNLTRHGFSIVTQGYGQGHYGAWHTGPCGGINFPHFGISTDGTKWALDGTRAALKRAKAARTKLDTNPAMKWTPDKWAVKKNVEPVKVELGDVERYFNYDGTPQEFYGDYTVISYAKLHKVAVANVDGEIKSLTGQVAFYVKAIKEWVAKDATPVADAPSGHKKVNWKNREGVSAPLCKQWSMRYPAGTAVFAKTDAEIGCKSCLKAMERDAKEEVERAAKKAANKTYVLRLPNGELASTTNDKEMTKRPIISAVIVQAMDDDRWHVTKWAVSEATAKKACRESTKATYRFGDDFGKPVWKNVQIVEVEVLVL